MRRRVGSSGHHAVALHAPQKLHEGAPVVKHEVAHAQKGDLHERACARALPKRRVRDALEGVVVVALQRVLARQRHVHQARRLDHLLQQALRAAAAVVGVLAVAHLDAREVQPARVPLGHAHKVGVAAAVARVVVARRQLRRVGGRLVPPVHARQLGAQAARGVELVHQVPVRADPGGAVHALHAGPVHGGRCGAQHAVRMPQQQARVPAQKKGAVGRAPAAGVAVEEAGLPGLGVVAPRVVRAAQPPLRLAHLVRGDLEVVQHVLVVALELAHAGEAPAAIALRVRGVAQLAGGAHAHGDLRHAVTKEVLKVVGEGRDEVVVHLDGRAALENLALVAAEREALHVAVAVEVGVPDVGVGLADLHHPVGQRDLARVAHVAAGRVEAHDRLQLEPLAVHLVEQLLVGGEVVLLRRSLREAPPHVHHHALHARLAQRLQPLVQRRLALQLGHHLAVLLYHPHRV
mmetsp:Transcript_39027/g.98099  ORF Transcript_39027/g.98099 Transcript_39027/m.98099 type:complete len:462 (+) Transcript_39027:161-1546(+)